MNKILSQSSLEFVKKIYGSLEMIESSKVLYSILVKEKDGKYNVIVKNELTPHFDIDWQQFCFLRACSDAFITTGETIRAERNISSMTNLETFGRTDWEKLYKLSGSQKRSLVLSKKTSKDDIFTLPFYSQTPHINKLLTSNETLLSQINQDKTIPEFLQQNSIQLVPQFQNIIEAVQYIRVQFPENRVLVETGVQASEPLFQITDPAKQQLDFLVLSVYRGKLDEQFIGREHPSIESLKGQFKIFNISQQFPVFNGTVQFYSLVKKNLDMPK